MKKIFQFTCFVTACAFFVSACQKATLIDYTQPDMVYFYKASASTAATDSTTYSFAIRDASLQFDTVFIPVRIMGVAKDYDREVKLGAVDSLTTAVAGEDYELLPGIVPGGSYTAEVPVKVKRAPASKTVEKRLVIEIQQSKDFLPGIPDTKASSVSNSYSGAGTRYLIKINDFLTKPDNWDTFLKYFFGSYSQVKYAFVIKATGRAEFPWGPGPDSLPYGQFSYYQQICKNALADYEAVNGPLIDEFGNRVTF